MLQRELAARKILVVFHVVGEYPRRCKNRATDAVEMATPWLKAGPTTPGSNNALRYGMPQLKSFAALSDIPRT